MNHSIPQTMNAIQLDKPNGKLMWRKIPVPHPQPGRVLIRMAASPINPSDLGALFGMSYSGRRKYPFTPGLEGSGTVVEVGAGLMPRLLKGRRVACSALTTGDGTWAEYMVTSAKSCIPLRKGVSLEQGAMMLVNPLTALAMFEIAKRGKHRAMVSTAAASALGGMLLRLGKRHQISIIHIVRRQMQVDVIRGRGGEHILNSSGPDFVEQLRTAANQLRATLLLDAIGDGMTQQLVDAAPFGSTILLYSRLSQQNSVIDPFTALVKGLHFDGWFLSNWLGKKNLFQIFRLSRQAQSLLGTDLRAPVHQRLPLSAAQQGVETYIQNMTAGKILLVANPQEVGLHP
jgi:NADPH2:quinone reductase